MKLTHYTYYPYNLLNLTVSQCRHCMFHRDGNIIFSNIIYIANRTEQNNERNEKCCDK